MVHMYDHVSDGLEGLLGGIDICPQLPSSPLTPLSRISSNNNGLLLPLVDIPKTAGPEAH